MFNTGREKVAVFIDAVNLDYTMKALGFSINWVKFRKLFDNHRMYLSTIKYYTAVDELEGGERPLQRLLDFLSDNGYELVTKKAKAYVNRETGERRVKGNIDVEFTCDVLSVCQHVDRVVLVTGDGDFATLVQRVQLVGRRVTIVSSKKSNMLSGDLRRAAGGDLMDLADMRELVCGN